MWRRPYLVNLEMKISRTTHPRWKWRVDADASYGLHAFALRGHQGTLELRGSDGQLYAMLVDGFFTIFAGYHFDGATCAPDFEDGLEGFAVHDALLQLLDIYPGAFAEQTAHDAMLEVHTVSDFQLRNFYHWAVSSWPRKLYKLFKR